MALLEIKDYSISYKIKNRKLSDNKESGRVTKVRGNEYLLKVVDNVSLEIESEDIFGIVGESGSGKTTLAKGILSRLDNTEGDIILDGKKLKDYDRKELSETVQMIFQDPSGSFNPRFRIEKSLSEVARVHNIPKSDYEKLLNMLLKKTSLDKELLYRYPSQLSGGQLQRFAIVRVLLLRPKLLVADEAVSALDVSIRADILKLLRKLHDELDIGIIFISHDLNVVRKICNRVAVMYLGQIVETGDTREVYDNPKHDYTKLLLASKTKTDPDEEKEEVFFDDVPNIFEIA